MALFVAGLALTAAGTVFSMYQQKQQSAYMAEITRRDAENKAAAARFNSEQDRMNAGEIVRAAYENRRLGFRAINQNSGAQRASAAARGVSVTSATAEDLLYEQALMGEFVIQEQFRAQFAESIGLSSQAVMRETMARFGIDMSRHQAAIHQHEGRVGMATTALTGASTMAMASAQHQTTIS